MLPCRLGSVALLVSEVAAQTLVTADQSAQIAAPRNPAPLECHVDPLRPVLDFSLRYQGGYTVSVPLRQYRGPGHHWQILVRVQPAGGAPVYFLDHFRLPDIPETNAKAEAGGSFLAGEGRYAASLVLLDDQARVCRAEWDLDVRPAAGAQHLQVAIQPGAVKETGFGKSNLARMGRAPFRRLTVLLHAAPASPRMAAVQASDAVVLVGALSSLLSLAPAPFVRLVVFSLDQQKEIYHSDNFTASELDSVRQAMFELQLAAVSYGQLQNAGDLLESLVKRELRSSERSDAVIFLGPRARATVKSSFRVPAGSLPRFFYMEYAPPRSLRMGSDELAGVGTSIAIQNKKAQAGVYSDGGTGDRVIPGAELINTIDGPAGTAPPRDSIDLLVSRLKGTTFVINTPADFARAIGKIR